MLKTKFLTGAIFVLVLMFLAVSVMGAMPDLELGGLEPADIVVALTSAESPESRTAEPSAPFDDVVFWENSASDMLNYEIESQNVVSVILISGARTSTANILRAHKSNAEGVRHLKFIYLA